MNVCATTRAYSDIFLAQEKPQLFTFPPSRGGDVDGVTGEVVAELRKRVEELESWRSQPTRGRFFAGSERVQPFALAQVSCFRSGPGPNRSHSSPSVMRDPSARHEPQIGT